MMTVSKAHRGNPIEVIGPRVDRSGEQRMEVVEAGSKHDLARGRPRPIVTGRRRA